MRTKLQTHLFLLIGLMLITTLQCKKEENPELPLADVNTSDVTNILINTAVCGGVITDDGGLTVKSRGVCWSRYPQPTLANEHSIDGEGAGTFISKITGLSPNTKYYLRAYVTTANGTNYGSSMVFITVKNWLTDLDSNEYKSVQIGDQIWMAENLKTTKYCDSLSIPNVEISVNWGVISYGARAAYDNNPLNSEIYGYLYNWHAVIQPRKLAPEGWHIPTKEEWEELIEYLGGDLIAGGKLKADTFLWSSPNNGTTNEYGFSVLPGGHRTPSGNFLSINQMCNFWSATEDGGSAYHIMLQNATKNIYMYTGLKNYGFSVRCIRD